jgi:hypothetical protein
MTDHQPGDGVKGHTDPVRTPVPGRWRITLSRVMPEGSWRERLLELAQAIPEGQETEDVMKVRPDSRVEPRPEPRLAPARRGPLPPGAPAPRARPQRRVPARAGPARGGFRARGLRMGGLQRLAVERGGVPASGARPRGRRAGRLQLHARGPLGLPGGRPAAWPLARAGEYRRGRVRGQWPGQRGRRLGGAQSVARPATLALAHAPPLSTVILKPAEAD